METLRGLLDLYYKATSIKINMNTSLLLLNELGDNIKVEAKIIFPLRTCDLERVKYLGYFLKPNDYHYEDWVLAI